MYTGPCTTSLRCVRDVAVSDCRRRDKTEVESLAVIDTWVNSRVDKRTQGLQ